MRLLLNGRVIRDKRVHQVVDLEDHVVVEVPLCQGQDFGEEDKLDLV
jgi:hypothetical protein